MCSAGLEFERTERVITEPFEYRIVGDSRLSADFYNCHPFAFSRISPDISLNCSAVFLYVSGDNAQIFSGNRVDRQLFRNLTMCNIVFTDDQCTGRVLIDPMYNSGS